MTHQFFGNHRSHLKSINNLASKPPILIIHTVINGTKRGDTIAIGNIRKHEQRTHKLISLLHPGAKIQIAIQLHTLNVDYSLIAIFRFRCHDNDSRPVIWLLADKSVCEYCECEQKVCDIEQRSLNFSSSRGPDNSARAGWYFSGLSSIAKQLIG